MKADRILHSLVRGLSVTSVVVAFGCSSDDEGTDIDSSSAALAAGEITIFSPTDRPTIVADGDTSAVELGVRFRTDVSGTVNGIRYYRSSANTGVHTAHLWSNRGTLLASATFASTTTTGWQTVYFAQPVAVSAGRTYVASYHTDVGRYSADNGYFTGKSKDSGPLHALADSDTSKNGVYHYGATAFPTDTYQGSNYWVDVIVKPSGGAPPPPPADAGTPPPADAGTAPPADAGATPPDASPPPPDAGAGAHPFPFSFNDPQFFSNVVASGPVSLPCGTRTDLSITSANNGDAVVGNACGTGTSTMQRFRLGGDGVSTGFVREGYRCGGSGTMNIFDSWMEAKGVGADHADVIQCYDPNNSPTAVMNLKNTTIRAYDGAATAGVFVADSYALDLYVENVMFWGGPYGLRFHTDGRPGSLHMKDVCFYGTGPNDHSFSYNAYLFNPYPPTFAEWTNVNWCTIENGQLVKHGPVAHP